MAKERAVEIVIPKGVVGKAVGDKELLKEAQVYFYEMQRSWYSFAKVIHSIKIGESYLASGYTSFKDYIETEFSSLNYDTAIKFVNIIESWGATFESRRKKEPEYLPPAYESCYTLINLEKRNVAPKEEISRIKKQLLDNKMSYSKLREALKVYVGKLKETGVAVDSEEIERQLAEDIEKDGDFEDAEYLDTTTDEDIFEVEEDDETDEVVEDDEEEVAADANLSVMLLRVNFLIDNLPAHESTLKEVTNDLVRFATRLEDLVEMSEAFLNRVEKLSREK